MPYSFRLPRSARLLCALTGAVVSVGCAPAIASACTVQTSGGSEFFAQYGDHADYVLAPGGSFTSGAAGWTLDDAAVHGGDGTFAASAWIDAGGDAISAPICVSSATPTFRFFARQVFGAGARVQALILWTDSYGRKEVTPVGVQPVSAAWAPSAIDGLGDLLPTAGGDTFTARIVLAPVGSGAVAITDLYVDPYSRSDVGIDGGNG